MPKRLLPIFFFLLSAVAAFGQDQVNASLVSPHSAVAPDSTFTAALRLEHKDHWHTYWINPGTGYPTSIEWDLPEGWSASEIQWPAPIIIRDSHGMITGNGYEGVTYLPVAITVPAGAEIGSEVTLKGHADWLMCADVCIPGDAAIELTLAIAASHSGFDTPHAEAMKADLGSLRDLPDDVTVLAEKNGEVITLILSGYEGAIENPWFFASDALVQFDLPQTADHSTNGQLVLTLPVSEFYDGAGDRLVGVLRQDGSWDNARNIPGLIIDVAFGSISAAGGTANNAAPAAAATGSILGTLALAFVGGLILNLMPCVFPVLGIKIMGFVNQAGEDRRKVALHGWVFSLGVLSSFWSLAGVLAILRAGGDQLGWGFQLQSPVFVFILAAVMLVFALAMSGVFEFGMSATGVGANLQSKDGLTGSFFTGVLATVVATPCSAPFLAPALGAALALPTAQSFLVFTFIAVGLSMPYLLLSLFPGAIKILPRPGAWMETFKQVMAFPLYATVGALVWVLVGQTSEGGSLNAILGLTVIAMAVWLYGRYAKFGAKPASRRIGIWGGLAILIAGTALGWPRSPAPTDIVWTPWSPAAIASAQAEGRQVYVDFTARWCATCQTNKKIVFGSDEVKTYFRDNNVLTLKADWTKKDAEITQELARWGRSAVPFNLIYLPDAAEPQILPELLTPGIVLDALE
ncbi:protein-disulfide reductase DsbD family protein [Opitutaceae bacterium]|nr:protein-disulfide reductase DsbD family protein [Opitutaceae bacterium]